MSTRSELKENVLATKVESSVGWMMENRVPVLTGLGMVIGVILIGSVFIIRKQEKKEIDWTRLSQAQALVADNKFDAADSLLTDIAASNPGAEAGLYARFNLAQSQLAQKKYDLAIQSFTDVVAQSGGKPLRPLALSNLGFAHEQKGDFSSAADTYRQFLEQYGEHFLAARVQLRLGISLLRKGDTEGGRKALGQLIDLYPTSPWAENARRFMDKSKTR